jgi:hypothetical protein
MLHIPRKDIAGKVAAINNVVQIEMAFTNAVNYSFLSLETGLSCNI